MKILFDLFFTFAKMGAITFGGGYAMLPILQRTVVEKRHWATEEELLDYYAIGQCTPGVIAVNTATFIGYKQKGYSLFQASLYPFGKNKHRFRTNANRTSLTHLSISVLPATEAVNISIKKRE